MVKPNTGNKGPSQRQLRVGELIRHVLSSVLGSGAHMTGEVDTRLLTVTEVRMSPDLKIATVFIMPLGGKNSTDIPKLLSKNVRPLRSELARQLNLKFTPDLRFLVDESFDRGAHIDALLNSPEVKRDLLANDGNEDDLP